MNFVHTELEQTVHFAPGGAEASLASVLHTRGYTRAMLITSVRERPRALTLVPPHTLAAEFTDVRVHVPTHLARMAIDAAAAAHADVTIAVGGGSAIGFAKAIALETSIPIIAVPTTYAGSEATNMWGMTENAVKRTGISSSVLPADVIYDSDFTTDLPHDLTTLSGVNALAHCIDAMWAPHSNPILRATAEEAVRQLSQSLRTLTTDPRDREARNTALLGVYLAGRSFSQSGSGLHHKLCHVLGGHFNLPHAEVHAAVLPAVTALNVAADPEAELRVSRAFGSPTATQGVHALYRTMGIAPSLRELGLSQAAVLATTELCLAAVPPSNPVPVNEALMRELLTQVWQGLSPSETHDSYSV